jgi:hypothetical protein
MVETKLSWIFNAVYSSAFLLPYVQGEHGTGRNMAPFVELEWGREAAAVMLEIKDIFDPRHLLNPGVILNQVIDWQVSGLSGELGFTFIQHGD